MKALSIKQPWAWLIVNGFKSVENRTWNTKYRGKFLIHASKKIDEEGIKWMKAVNPQVCLPAEFETGGIVGVAEIVDVVTEHPSRFFFGPYGFVLNDVNSLPFIHCKGQLGFFNPQVEVTP